MNFMLFMVKKGTVSRRLAVAFLCTVAVVGCSDRARLERHLERANAYFEKGAYPEASIEYLNALRLDRTNHVAVLGVGLSYYETGKPVQALPFLRASLEADPDHLDVRLKLGLLYRVGQDLAAARGEALEILRRDPRHFEGLLLLADTSFAPDELNDVLTRLREQESEHGEKPRHRLALAHTYLKQGEAEEARRAYESARAMAPDDVVILEASGRFYALTGDRARAEEAFAAAVENAPPASAVRVRYAAYKYDLGERDEAKQLLRSAVEHDPSFVLAWEKIGEFALREGNHDECAEAVSAILQDNPDHVAGLQLQARLLLVQGETESAITAFENLLSGYPQSASLHHQAALAYLRDGNMERGHEALREAVRLNPNNIAARLQLLGMELRSGNPGLVIVEIEQILRTHPNHEEALYLLGRAYAANREPERAVEALRHLWALRPDDHTVPYFIGRILQRLRRTDEARGAFESALELKPGFLPALGGLVALDLLEEEPQRAAERVQEVIRDHPDSRGLHHLLGSVYAREGRVVEAEEAFRQEIEIEPQQIESYVALARLLYAGNRLEEALEEVEDALRLNANNLRALMMSGIFHEQQTEYPRAVERYEAVLALSPDFAPAANNAAYLYAEELDDLDKGLALARRARELAPEDGSVADTLGWIAYKRGEHAWALTLIQEAADAFPDHPVVQYHLGMAHLALGNEAEAGSALRRSLEPGDETLPQREQSEDIVRLLDLRVDEVTADANPLLDAILSDQPDNPSAWVRKAVLFEQDQQWEKARETYQRILDKNPRFQPALVRLIRLLDVHDEDIDAALSVARTAFNYAPEDPEIAHLAGWLAYRAGEYDWAYGLLRDSRRRIPGDPLVSYHAAAAAYAMGGVDEARSFVDDSIGNGAPPEAVAFSALLHASRAEQVSPEDVALAESIGAADPRYLVALMVSARGREQQEDSAGAIQTYERLRARAPRFGPAARNAARLYAEKLNDDASAFPLAMTARELLPVDPDVSAILGSIVYRREEYDWARQLLRETVAARPADADARYLLGFCHARLGDTAAARTVLGEALNLEPDSPHADEARRILAEGR